MSQLMYSGVFAKGTGAEYLVQGNDFDSFVSGIRFNEGFRVTSYDATVIDGNVHYAAIIHPGSGGEWIVPAMDRAAFVAWGTEKFAQGYRTASLSTCVVNGVVRYAAVVRDGLGLGAEWMSPTMAWDAFANWNNDQFAQGNRLVALATCEVNGTVMYTGVVRSGVGGEWVKPAQPVGSFFAWGADMFSQGFRMTSMSTVYHAGDVLYTGVMRAGTGASYTVPAMSLDSFQAKRQSFFNQGFRLTALAVTTAVPRTATWSLSPLSAGKVDFNGGSVILKDDGSWQFYGSLHDNSTWTGDNWFFGFVLGNTGHGAVASGTLGAEFSGPAVNGTFNMSGKDPWIAAHWEDVYKMTVHTTLHVEGDPTQLLQGIMSDFVKYGPTFISLL